MMVKSVIPRVHRSYRLIDGKLPHAKSHISRYHAGIRLRIVCCGHRRAHPRAPGNPRQRQERRPHPDRGIAILRPRRDRWSTAGYTRKGRFETHLSLLVLPRIDTDVEHLKSEVGMCMLDIQHTHTKVTMRIGIYVPNKLLERVKAIRPEANVSQICRDALEEYAYRSERVAAQAAADPVAEHLARIGESDLFPLIEPDWEGLALEDARNWLAKATPNDWDRYLEIHGFLERRGRKNETWFADVHGIDEVKRFPHREAEHREWLLTQYEIDPESQAITEARERYRRTFVAYLEEVRRLWEEQRKEIRDTVMGERTERMRDQGKPELPPQLLD